MNAQDNSIRHSALGWVKQAIDDSLSEIQTDLKRHIEKNEQGLLDGVRHHLAVVQGVLVMIEQYGAAMLTEEMVALVDYVVAKNDSDDDQALKVLLQAVLQLPGYLENIQSGHHDNPIAILPLFNDVRAVRNQDLFSEKLLFLPDLSMHEGEAEIGSIDDASNQESRLLAKKLRPVYQLALVNIIRDKSVGENLKRLEQICELLKKRSVLEQIARIWWIVGALVESVAHHQFELGVSIKNLLGKVDALFRVILISGERGLLKHQPVELIKNFLYYIAQPECNGSKAQVIKTAYRLEQFLPSESARSEVQDNIAGPNQALLKTVAESMKTEVESIRSALEFYVYVNGGLSQIDALKDLPQEMHVISDTLAMIGLGEERQLIEAHIESVKQILTADQTVDRDQLLSMAAELLQVEQALDQMSKRQSERTEQTRTEPDFSRHHEQDSALSTVVTVALEDIQKTKTAILEFIKYPERSENIDLCIALMLESRGAIQVFEQQRVIDVVDGLLKYLRGYQIDHFMESSHLDSLSQIVVSLEYYLEALGEHRNDAEGILDLADHHLQRLLASLDSHREAKRVKRSLVTLQEEADVNLEATGPAASQDRLAEDNPEDTQVLKQDAVVEELDQSRTPVMPEPDVETFDLSRTLESTQVRRGESDVGVVAGSAQMDSTVIMSPQGSEAERQASDESNSSTKSVTESTGNTPEVDRDVAKTAVSEQPGTVDILQVNDGVEVLKPGCDAEILEIYLEEAEEESANIVRLQKDWMLYSEDENALKNICRAFHTIKGSGRLVGALKISEFAWEYEQLLNRVIDKTVPPGKHVIKAVGEAGTALTELVHELKTSEEPNSDIPYLRGLARALAEFKMEEWLIEPTQTTSVAESPHDHSTNAEESKSASNDSVLTKVPPIQSANARRPVKVMSREKLVALARARAESNYQRATDYSQRRD
ncbi:MAG: hypothetical protein GY815_07725 [Gammaproteobacteria bacterium]|nr:hypothetical protein [Gammaproteobacteria bacterium]